MFLSSAWYSHGAVLRVSTTCGSTSEWSPRLPSGGKTAYTSGGRSLKRSPATVNRRRVGNVSGPIPGPLTSCWTSMTYCPGGIAGR